MKIVVDTYAWIEQYIGSANGDKIKEILESADVLYTPDIVLAEIARKYIREGIANNMVSERLEQIAANSTIVYLDPKLALEAAKCYMELNQHAQKNKLNTPSLADAIILATGRVLKAKILTGDKHFKSLPETVQM